MPFPQRTRANNAAHRHGLRLDAADKQWHLTSPTPYDPPLTYNGWLQAKSLGVRIGNIIREMVAEKEAAETQSPDTHGKRKRKKYKVVLHSSPFLRCIQTSIAISAGLAQDSTPFGASQPAEMVPSPPVLSPRTRPAFTPEGQDVCIPSPKTVPIRKSVLRLDAFLSEWLSPGYFELITPPPESVMMLASAKADLLRREDYNSYPNFGPIHSGSLGHLWNSETRMSSITSTNGPSDSLDSVSGPGSLQRSVSISSQGSLSRKPSAYLTSETSGYVSPVPHWAVNPKHTIPLGYVSHARDACVDIDYQWDSMRSPLDWGDGGTFPEEWTAMHRRFRKGVQHLVDWYSTAENPTDMVTKTASRFARKLSIDVMDDLDEEDVETEAIVIIVSHGAGCNALIGAITHQPVLMDVAMASLTLAVRKPNLDTLEDDRSSHASHSRGWASPERKHGTIPIHQLYNLKMFASTDHLRSPPPTPAISRSPSVASVVNNTRGRYVPSLSSTLSNFTFDEGAKQRSSSASPALSGLRKGGESSSLPTSKLAFNMTNPNGGRTGGITIGSGVTSFGSTKPFGIQRTPSIGLWSPISQRGDDAFDDDDEDDPMLLNFSHEKITPAEPVKPIDLTPQVVTPRPLATEGYFDLNSSNLTSRGADGAKGSEKTTSPINMTDTPRDSSPGEDSGTGGLWVGTPTPIDEADQFRDTTSAKRRWTVTERS